MSALVPSMSVVNSKSSRPHDCHPLSLLPLLPSLSHPCDLDPLPPLSSLLFATTIIIFYNHIPPSLAAADVSCPPSLASPTPRQVSPFQVPFLSLPLSSLPPLSQPPLRSSAGFSCPPTLTLLIPSRLATFRCLPSPSLSLPSSLPATTRPPLRRRPLAIYLLEEASHRSLPPSVRLFLLSSRQLSFTLPLTVCSSLLLGSQQQQSEPPPKISRPSPALLQKSPVFVEATHGTPPHLQPATPAHGPFPHRNILVILQVWCIFLIFPGGCK